MSVHHLRSITALTLYLQEPPETLTRLSVPFTPVVAPFITKLVSNQGGEFPGWLHAQRVLLPRTPQIFQARTPA